MSLILGQWNALCDRCGVEYKARDLKDEWTGLKVCCHCWESRHPQTLLRVPHDEGSIPWSRPEPDDIFTSVSEFILAENLDPIMPESGVEVALQTE